METLENKGVNFCSCVSLKESKSNEKKKVLNMASIEERLTRLEKSVDEINTKLNMLLGDTNMERFYQRYLEKKYGASHMKGVFGITDVETEDLIIEIKRWNRYKEALGQLLSYTCRLHRLNNTAPKEAIVYFFGDKPKHVDNIIRLFKDNNISVFHLYTLGKNVMEEELNYKHPDDKFSNWLQTHIEYKENYVLKLKDVIKCYNGKEIGTKLMNPYKRRIEMFIHLNFPLLDNQYKNTTTRGKSYRGWLHLKLKEM